MHGKLVGAAMADEIFAVQSSTQANILPDPSLPVMPPMLLNPVGGLPSTTPATAKDLANKVLLLEAENLKHTEYIRSMHSWAKNATNNMRDLQTEIAQQRKASQQKIAQLKEENDTAQVAIMELQVTVRQLMSEVHRMSEQRVPSSPGIDANNNNKRKRHGKAGLERLGSSLDVPPDIIATQRLRASAVAPVTRMQAVDYGECEASQSETGAEEDDVDDDGIATAVVHHVHKTTRRRHQELTNNIFVLDTSSLPTNNGNKNSNKSIAAGQRYIAP